jgi:hypothetical protein
MVATSSVRVKQSLTVCKALKELNIALFPGSQLMPGRWLFVFDLLAARGYPSLLFASHLYNSAGDDLDGPYCRN